MRKTTHLRIEYAAEGSGPLTEDDWARVIEFGLRSVQYFNAFDAASEARVERLDEVDMEGLKREVKNLC